MDSKIKEEIGEVRGHFNTEMNTVNKRIDGLVNKIKRVKEEVEKTTRPKDENQGKSVVIKMLLEKTGECDNGNKISMHSVNSLVRDEFHIRDARVITAVNKKRKGNGEIPGVIILNLVCAK